MKNFAVAIICAIFFFGGCASVTLPQNKITSSSKNIESLKSNLSQYQSKISHQRLVNEAMHFVKAGDTNMYGIKIDTLLANATDAYLAGNNIEALRLINTNQNKENLYRWQLAFLKMQVLINNAQAADAIEEFKTCQKYEIASFNSDLNCMALQGEAYTWLEDYQNAKDVYYKVLSNVDGWEFPTSYGLPPANMADLVSVTTAKLRSLAGLGAIGVLEENYQEAFFWANEAQKRFNDVHYVSNHPLYGKFITVHLDSYYGKAINQTMLASAKLALNMDEKSINTDYEEAKKFFDLIGYKKGVATILALKARVYNLTGQYDKCNLAGNIALQYSLQNNILDFVWRIEALRGKTFEKLGEHQNAYEAYKRANSTLNAISSLLASDVSKRVFGIGKDDVTLALMHYNILFADTPQLFKDLEESRARAFIQMFSKKISDNKSSKTLIRLNEVSTALKEKMIFASALNPSSTIVDSIKELQNKQITLSEQLKKEDFALYQTHFVWSSNLAQTQTSLKKGENIWYFLPSAHENEKIKYLQITQDSALIQELNATFFELTADLQTLSKALGLNDTTTRALKNKTVSAKKANSNTIAQISTKLSNLFAFDANVKTYIVPTQTLFYLPWGLISDSNIALLPTASWLQYTPHENNAKEIVIFANPQFHGELTQLEGAAHEAITLGKLYNTEATLDHSATKENLYKQVGSGVKILHLATHAFFNPHDPLQSAIALSHKKNVDFLTAEQLYTHPLKASLVVLSACETGLGKASSGDDMLGLNRSLFLGGTQAIMGSLWPIDDAGTAQFMEAFYRQLKLSNDYSQSWQFARTKLKNDGLSPTVYGAFILNGK